MQIWDCMRKRLLTNWQKIGKNHTFLDHDAFYRKSMETSSFFCFVLGDFFNSNQISIHITWGIKRFLNHWSETQIVVWLFLIILGLQSQRKKIHNLSVRSLGAGFTMEKGFDFFENSVTFLFYSFLSQSTLLIQCSSPNRFLVVCPY